MLDVAIWILSMSLMTEDMMRPVECDSKNWASCRSSLSNTFWRISVTAVDADPVHQVIAEIVAQTANEKDQENSECHHVSDVVNPFRSELMQIQRRVRERQL